MQQARLVGSEESVREGRIAQNCLRYGHRIFRCLEGHFPSHAVLNGLSARRVAACPRNALRRARHIVPGASNCWCVPVSTILPPSRTSMELHGSLWTGDAQ